MSEPLPFDMPPLEAPAFPDRLFDVRDFGAVDDGTSVNTQAFARAVEACHNAGGGIVRIPAGTWLIGPIHLRSKVNLCLEQGALVRFSTRPADYLPPVFTRWEGVECHNYSPLIYACDCERIAVTGEGILDGQGQAWWHWKKLQQAAVKSLYDAQFEGVPVERRVYGTEEAALRPQFLQPIRCRDVLVEGVTFLNGPMWTIHPVYCENVLVRGVTVRTEGPNTDGLNPDSCRNVLIEGCSFATGDDCIAINSGMNEDGWRVGRPCENVVIRDCTMSEGHGAVAIGSGMSGGVRHVHISDCRFAGGDQGIRLKSMRGRGGVVEDVHVDNIFMAGLRQEAIVLNMFYGSSTAASRSDAPPTFRDIHIKNVTCDGAGVAVAIRGLPEQPVERVVLEDLRLSAVEGIHCQNADDLSLRDVTCIAQQEPLFDCSSIRGLNVVDMRLKLAHTER
ncbi:MAG: glycoside hydrolase family 28 protein [Anaerolineae bacterium]|nr:glycoside hydrolase family 28 protein [Anaerolineae bacterium]